MMDYRQLSAFCIFRADWNDIKINSIKGHKICEIFCKKRQGAHERWMVVSI